MAPQAIQKTSQRERGGSAGRGGVAGRPNWQSTLRPDAALAAGIFFSVLLVYWPALAGGLIWDDNAHITPPALRSLQGLRRIWLELGATQQYYPLLHSAFWLEHRLWGDAVLGYHLVNLTLHALSAFLVVLIVRRLELPGAWLAGWIFAVHPVCVEAVAWISEQKSTLSGAFYLAAALTYLHFDRSRRRSQYFLALGFFLLALLSKSVTATLPAALLVVMWWKRGGIERRRDVMPLVPWFAVSIASGLFTAWVERAYIGAAGKDYALTGAQHILLAGRIAWFYAGKMAWPANLMFSYPRWQIDARAWWQYLYPVSAVALLAGLCVLARRRDGARRGPLAGLLFFGGTLFPVLGFLHVYPFRFSYVADHFQYLASLGIIVPAAWLVAQGVGRFPSAKWAGSVAGVLLLIALGAVSRQQSSLYGDPEALYRATLERNPNSWLTHTNLASVLVETPSRGAEAMEEYRTAVRIKPDYSLAHNSLGGLLMKQPGGVAEAITEFQAAIQAEPGSVLAHNNLGIAYSLTPGRLDDAVAEFKTALRLDPTYAKAHMNLGNAYTQMPGRLDDAITEYQAALKLQPDYVPTYKNLGMILMQTPGRLEDAVGEFQAALQRDRKDAKAHELLADALAQMPGRMPDAIAEYQAALAIQPNDAATHLSFADALAKLRDRREEAIAQYDAVLQLRPDSEEARRALEGLKALEGEPRRVKQ